MKRIISIIMATLIMVTVLGGTKSEAKTRDEKCEEMVTIICDYVNKDIEDSEDYAELKEELGDDFNVEMTYKKLDTGIYDITMNIKLENDLIDGHMVIDAYKLDPSEFDFEKRTYESINESEITITDYYKFNGRRVSEEFVYNYVNSFIEDID